MKGPRGAAAAGRLERRYRLLIRTYPRWYRRERGTELLTTLLDAAAPDQRRPTFAETADLLRGGLRQRIVPPRGAGYRLVIVIAAGIAALAGAALAGLAGPYPGPPSDRASLAAAQAAMGRLPAGASNGVMHCAAPCPSYDRVDAPVVAYDHDLDHTDQVQVTYDVPTAGPGAMVHQALDRLAAAGWRLVEPLRHQEDHWGPCDHPDCSKPMVYDSFTAARGGLAVTVVGSGEQGSGANPAVTVHVTKRASAGVVATIAAGFVAGLVLGWLTMVWVQQRYRRHARRRRRATLFAGVPALAGACKIGFAAGAMTGANLIDGAWTAKDLLLPAFAFGVFPTLSGVAALSAALLLVAVALPGSGGPEPGRPNAITATPPM